MGVLTSGLVSISVYKLKTKKTLRELHDAATGMRYPINPDHMSFGWGSLRDDERHLRREACTRKFSGGEPDLVAVGGTASAIRMRYYYDDLSIRLRNRYGDASDWRNFHERLGFDVLILDEGEDDQYTALVSVRESGIVKSEVLPALSKLLADIDPGATVGSQALDEEIEPDLYTWLLYRLATDGKIGEGITLNDVSSIESRDAQGRRAKFSSGAGSDRVELMALISKDQMKFGPAKVSIKHDADPEGYFDLQIEPDGGFSIYRSSEYKDDPDNPTPREVLGRRLAEDAWQVFLPKIRARYRADSAWRDSERADFIIATKAELDATTAPPSISY